MFINEQAITPGLFFHHFSLNSSWCKLKLFPKLKQFFAKLKVSEILKLEFFSKFLLNKTWFCLLEIYFFHQTYKTQGFFLKTQGFFSKLKDFLLNSRIFLPKLKVSEIPVSVVARKSVKK